MRPFIDLIIEVIWTFSFACEFQIKHPTFVFFRFRSLGYTT